MLRGVQPRGPTMGPDSMALLEAAKALNGKVFSLPRIQLLGVLNQYHPEGIEFRELKAALGMGDGKLLSNLYALRDMQLVKSEDVKVENQVRTSYTITTEGQDAWRKASSWLKQWLEVT